MYEQLYLVRDRSGVVHAARTQYWRSGLDWHEAGSEAEEAVEETLCEEHNYFAEVYDVPLTCVTCIVRVDDVEYNPGYVWKQKPQPQ